MTVNEAFDAGMERLQTRGISGNTIRVYRSQSAAFRRHFGPVQTDSISPWEVEAMIAGLPIQDKSRRQVLKVTQSILSHAGASCPWVEQVKLPFDRSRSTRDWLRPEQIISVLNSAYRTDSLKVFALQLFAGLSRAEVLPLRWRNVSSNMLRVEETMIITDNGQEIVPRTKAPARYRIIPLCPFLQDVMRNNRGEDHEFVNANPNGSPFSVGQYVYAQKLTLEMVGLRVGHELRHTFATLLSLTGIPDHMRMQLMGHAGKGITDRVYTHQWAEHSIPYVNQVEQLAFGEKELPTSVPADWL